MSRPAVRTAAMFFIAALVIYGTGLGHTPIYLHDSEILFGLHAHAIATTGHDLNGRLLPLYFQMPPIGPNVWFHPVLVYAVAAFLQVLPFAEWSVRFPTAVVGAIDVALIYLIAMRMFRQPRYAALAAGLLLWTPAHIIHSRLAMDYIYPLPFVLGWFLALSIHLERGNLRTLFAACVLLGVGVYSYIASVVMMPLYFCLTLVVLWWTSTLTRRTLTAAAAGFVLPLLAIPLWLAFHPAVVAETLSRYHANATPVPELAAKSAMSIDETLQRVRQGARFVDLTGRVSMFWYFFDPAYLFVTGGYANVVNSTRHVGVFALPLIVLVPLGLYRLIARPSSPLERLVIAGFVTAPLAACLATVEPNAIDRELEIVPFGVLAAVYGFDFLSSFGRRGHVAARVVLAAIPIHAAFFAYDYLVDYRGPSAAWFEFNHRGALERLVDEAARQRPPAIYLPSRADPYMESYWRFTLTKRRALDLAPTTVLYDSNEDTPDITPGGLVLMRSDDATLQKMVDQGALTLVTAITEPSDPPRFFVLRR